MKHGRIISIKNPKLRKIRNNLRQLFIEVYRTELSKSMNNADKIIELSEGDTSSLDMKKLRELNKQQNELGFILKRSTCICGMCSVYNEDIVWHAGWGEWWCLNALKRKKKQ